MERRTLLQGMGAAGAAGLFGAPAEAAPRAMLEEIARGDVTVLEGRARAQAVQTLDALLAMDEAMLLRPFREAAGLPVGPQRFGGWYDRAAEFDPPNNLTGFIPGHSFGQYVSALARGYAALGDARAKAKVGRLIAGFAPTITPDFYRGYPLPAYTYDKLLVGLIDAHRLVGDSQARALIAPVTDAVLPWLPGRALDRRETEKAPHPNMAFGWDETYTLPENLYLASEFAGERYRRLARAYLLDQSYFRPLAAGINVLPGRHAYSHVNALASAAKAYLIDGDPMHMAAAAHGMRFVADQSFATGGWGPSEAFVEPGSGKLGASLNGVHASFEAPCGSYGQFKVARYLMRITGDSRYGDGMERLLYNAALGALPLRPDGEAFYYADYSDAGSKTYYGARCPCCSGTIGQLTADYGISAYLRDGAGLYVNLYIPSRVAWRRSGEPVLTLTQGGGYPLDDLVVMSIAASRPVRMALRLRIPGWAGPATRATVNGRAVSRTMPGSFAVIDRVWRDGDRVELSIDRTLRLEPVDAEHPARVALVHGPLALFATNSDGAAISRERLLAARQAAPGATGWSAGPRTFRPYFAIGNEPTRLYQTLS